MRPHRAPADARAGRRRAEAPASAPRHAPDDHAHGAVQRVGHQHRDMVVHRARHGAADGGGQAKALSAAELEKVLDLAKSKGVQVLVVSPGTPEVPKQSSFADRLARVPATWSAFRERFSTLLDKTSGLPEHVRARLSAAELAPGADSLAVVFLGTSALLLLAWFAESLVRNRFAGARGAPTAPPTDGTARMLLLFNRFIGRAIGIVASGIAALALVAIVFSVDRLGVVTALLLTAAF